MLALLAGTGFNTVAVLADWKAPEYPNTSPHLDLAEGGAGSGLRLLGFDIDREQRNDEANIPQFKVGFPTELRAYWEAGADPPRDAELVLRIHGSGPRIEQVFPLNTGGWETGLVYSTPLTVTLPRFSHAGAGILTIALRRGGEQIPQAVEYYRGPSFTSQIITTSTFDENRLHALFGAEAVAQRVSFRLGRESRIAVRPREAVAGACDAIGIVSALHHSTKFAQGEIVARIAVRGGGHVQTLNVRAGIDTSLSEYDVPRPGTFALSPAPIASSRPHPGDRLTWNKQPLELYTYAATLPLDPPMPVREMEVSYESANGVIDIYDLVLLPAEGSTESVEERP